MYSKVYRDNWNTLGKTIITLYGILAVLQKVPGHRMSEPVVFHSSQNKSVLRRSTEVSDLSGRVCPLSHHFDLVSPSFLITRVITKLQVTYQPEKEMTLRERGY